MISANIATLKAKLSFYLRQVKLGHDVLVLDRNTPVARITASRPHPSGLVVTKARKSPRLLKSLSVAPLKHRTDVVALLREDRDRR